jgi:hypothetical protein
MPGGRISVVQSLGYGQDDRGFESRQGLGNFLFTTASRLALEPTRPPIQCETGALSLGVKLTTHLHLVSRSRMCGAIQFPQYAFTAWCSVKSTGTTLPLPYHKHTSSGIRTHDPSVRGVQKQTQPLGPASSLVRNNK